VVAADVAGPVGPRGVVRLRDRHGSKKNQPQKAQKTQREPIGSLLCFVLFVASSLSAARISPRR